MNAPVPYSLDVEDVKPDEGQTHQELCGAFDVILEKTAEDYSHAVRSVHAKSHGILKGTFNIHAGLPAELAQGMFATPGTHKVIMRLSTNAGDILPDTISLPRGMALKVLDVQGERLAGADGTTQDFVLVNGKVFQAKTADKFLGNLKMLAKTTDTMEGTKVAMSAALRGVNKALTAVGITLPAVASLGGAPNAEPLGETYYSTVPFRYGAYIAKFGMAPVAPWMTALTGKEIDVDDRKDAIRQDVRQESMSKDAVWEFRVQLCRDIDKQPVEDPTKEWDEKEFPFQTVATVTIPAQDSWAEAAVEEVNEGMRFGVWTGLAAHQPLGNINRARNDTYRHSANFRASFNNCPYREPVG